MNELAQLFANHTARVVAYWLLGYFFFTAAVDQLPTPDAISNRLGRWAVGTLHGFAGNLKRAAKAVRVPGSE